MNRRSAEVRIDGQRVGLIEETDTGFSFCYDDHWVRHGTVWRQQAPGGQPRVGQATYRRACDGRNIGAFGGPAKTLGTA
ncbi:MAG: hypothetical protein AAF355_11340 [Myxococcota bacterium]